MERDKSENESNPNGMLEYWNIGKQEREKIISSPYFYELIIPLFHHPRSVKPHTRR
jgi:hypothetical protein